MLPTPAVSSSTNRLTRRAKWLTALAGLGALVGLAAVLQDRFRRAEPIVTVIGDGASGVIGTVRSTSRQPLAGVQVTLDGPGGANGTAVSDANGCFDVFTMHAPGGGQIRVVLEMAGLRPLEQQAPAGMYSLAATLGTGVAGDTSYGQLTPLTSGDAGETRCVPAP